MTWKKHIIYIIIALVPLGLFSQTPDADLLKSKIEDRNNQIKKLEEEIKQYNLEVLNAGTQAKTLQSTIKTLDLTKKKITTDISLTENKINKANLTIEQLDKEIDDTQDHITVNKKAVASALKSIQQLEDNNLVVVILSKKNIGDIWGEVDSTNKIQEIIRDKSEELSILKDDMERKLEDMTGEKKNLLGLKQDLTGKKQAVEFTTQQKTVVLVETKNKEQTFKDLVKKKEEEKAQFEKELYQFESQLDILIDKGSYPGARNNILSWPLDDVYITQKFGKTVGAEKLYASGSHNGVDFRASIGTRVKNVLEGIVVGSGNTDASPGCYSFGKWVMVKHNNGLSTIYGHLSVISVSNGQNLKTGDIIGYSGNTGYSTGPHLHISVYATQGVRIEKYINSKGCKNVVLPLADVKAYLDPLSYFPNI